jgi:hypothetical protein
MSREQADLLVHFGKLWFQGVWVGDDPTRRDALIAHFNAAAVGDFLLSRGWQDYDPVLKKQGGRPETYLEIVKRLSGADDKGRDAAARFLDWALGDFPFAKLDETLQILALITHVCEVARGYGSTLNYELYPFLNDIAGGRANWTDIKGRYSPSLTFKEDAARDWTP